LKRPFVPVAFDLNDTEVAAAAAAAAVAASSVGSTTTPSTASGTNQAGHTIGFVKQQITVGRLHFNETTSNNMRKRGKPNPEQRYFALVVKLLARTASGKLYPVAAMISDKLIVRASNPGHFEQDTPGAAWCKGNAPNSLFHNGLVGINNNTPSEALCVDGNVRVTGTVLQPSDRRVKTDIVPIDTAIQLSNIRALPLYSYNLTPAWKKSVGMEDAPLQCGVLAQELQNLIPTAVRAAGDHTLADGSTIEQLLTVDKERLHMEALGAIKELASKTDRLEAMVAAQEELSASLIAELEVLTNDSYRTNIAHSSPPQVPNSLGGWVSGVLDTVSSSAKAWAEQLPILAAALSLVPM
jgi:hypothetical protein